MIVIDSGDLGGFGWFHILEMKHPGQTVDGRLDLDVLCIAVPSVKATCEVQHNQHTPCFSCPQEA